MKTESDKRIPENNPYQDPMPAKIKLSVPLLLLMFILYQLMTLYLISNLLSKDLFSISVIISLLVLIIMTIAVIQTYQRWRVLNSVAYREHVQQHVIPMMILEQYYQYLEQNQWGIPDEEIKELQ